MARVAVVGKAGPVQVALRMYVPRARRFKSCPSPGMRDHGDEDDVDLPPRRSYSPPRRIARGLAVWRLVERAPIIVYPARRLPCPANHDPGDEQPRFEICLWGEL